MKPQYVVGHLFSLCQKVGLLQNDLENFKEVNSILEKARLLILEAVDLLAASIKGKAKLQYKFDFDDKD